MSKSQRKSKAEAEGQRETERRMMSFSGVYLSSARIHLNTGISALFPNSPIIVMILWDMKLQEIFLFLSVLFLKTE